jgi:hypothetical protein
MVYNKDRLENFMVLNSVRRVNVSASYQKGAFMNKKNVKYTWLNNNPNLHRDFFNRPVPKQQIAPGYCSWRRWRRRRTKHRLPLEENNGASRASRQRDGTCRQLSAKELVLEAAVAELSP